MNPIFFGYFTASGGTATLAGRIPASAKNVTLHTQWMVPDTAANALGIALSEARKVVIR